GLACHLFREVLSRRAVEPAQLLLHQDRRSPMPAYSLGDLLSVLGGERSFPRPSVRNHNRCSESQFKTVKYWPSYPGRFQGEEHARAWCRELFPAYSRRPHEGLALFTPEDLYTGQFEALWRIRQAAMDRHYAAHPERYVQGPPQVARPPAVVSINPEDGQTAAELLHDPEALQISPTPVSIELPEVVT